jgi:hypothetical protein
VSVFLMGRIFMSQELTVRSLPFAYGKALWVLLFIWILVACNKVESIPVAESFPSPTLIPTDTPVVIPTPTMTAVQNVTETAIPTVHVPVLPIATPTITPSPVPTITHYTIWATLDNLQHHLTVTQTITYVNNTEIIHTALPLLVEPARFSDVFNLDSLLDEEQTPLTFRWENAHLTVDLPSLLLPGDYVTLHMAYSLTLPNRASDFGHTALQTNFGNWYPMVPPHTTEHGWIINQPAKVGEHLTYARADYDVYIKPLFEEPTPLIAASGLRQAKNGWYHYRHTNSRNFAWSVGYYETITTTVNGIQITSYIFPENRAAAQDAFDATVLALTYFSQLFAPYPHESLTVIDANFRDGMEFDGLYFIDRDLYQRYNGTPREYLIPIAVHETAHQWWQGIVGSDQAHEPWLDEALATYSELLFYEQYYPELVDWWWYFRVNRFEPSGAINRSIYEFDRFRPYVDTVYLRGARLLHEMREQAGDEQFFAFLQAYVRAGQQKEILTQADFWCIWQATTEIDSESFRERYFANDNWQLTESCQ